MKALLQRPLRGICSAITASFLLATGAHGAITLVDFDMTGTVTSGGGDKLVDFSPTTVDYSLSTASIDSTTWSSASNTTAPANNATIYGGFTGDNDFRSQDGTPDYLRTQQTNLQTGTYSFALVWKKEDFLNGQDSATVNIDSQSAYNMNMGLASSSAGGNADYGWIITKGTTTYVSEYSTFSGTAFDVYGAGTDLTSLEWYEVPSNWNMLDRGSLVADPSATGVFSDISGVGVYITSQNATMDNATGIQLNSFSASVIPEPSTGLLLAAGMGVFLLRRRRS